jgi:3-hydroxyacyl-CoA dehydrogenase
MSPGSVSLVGIGQIGAGWAAWFLHRGYSVTAYDASLDGSAQATDKLIHQIAQAWRKIIARDSDGTREADVCMAEAQSTERFRLVTSIRAALTGAHIVVESVFEDVEIKVQVLETISELVSTDCIIGSSTSFLPLSMISCRCIHPERVIITHPAQPQISRFVELFGTDQNVLERATTFFLDSGMAPIRLLKETPGHALNQLTDAGLNTVMTMMFAGIASPMDLDRTFLETHGWPASCVALEIGGGTPEGFLRLLHMIILNALPIKMCTLVNMCLGTNIVSTSLNRNLVLPLSSACVKPFEGIIKRIIAYKCGPFTRHMQRVSQLEGYEELLLTILRKREEMTELCLRKFAHLESKL